MNFLENLSALAQYAGQGEYAVDPDFLAQLPVFVTGGEQRVIRDLDLLTTHISGVEGALDANRRRFILPTADASWVVLQNIRLVVGNIVLPALDWISVEGLNVAYPGDMAVGVPSLPRYVSPLDQFSVLLGPAPDQPYRVLCDGVQNPKSLSTGATINLTASPPTIAIDAGSIAETGTYISNYIPDLFLAAQMIDVSAWLKNFGAMADDPKMAVDWSQEYDRLKSGELVQEARKTLESVGFSSRQPSPVATPPQT